MRRYTDAQWRDASRLWRDRLPPLAISQATGIPRPNLYHRGLTHPQDFPKRGPIRIPTPKLTRMRRDWERGETIATLAQRFGLHKSRFGQLARQYGWARHPDRHPGGSGPVRDLPGQPQPIWRRCCLHKLPWGTVCPSCGSL